MADVSNINDKTIVAKNATVVESTPIRSEIIDTGTDVVVISTTVGPNAVPYFDDSGEYVAKSLDDFGEVLVQTPAVAEEISTTMQAAAEEAATKAAADAVGPATAAAEQYKNEAASSAVQAENALDSMNSNLAAATAAAVTTATADSIAAANEAKNARDQTAALAASVGIVPSIAAGLAATTSGQYFTVGQGMESEAATITYLNNAGTAVPVFTTAGTQAVVNLSNNLLTLFTTNEFENAVAGVIDENDNSPWFVTPDGYVVINNINFFNKVKEIIDAINALSNLFTPLDDEYSQKAGWVDDEGKLPLFFDEYGDCWIGEGPVNLTEFVRNHAALLITIDEIKKEIYGTNNIICDGDSLTAGAGSSTGRGYVERLRTRLLPQGITVTKRAVGGQGAQSIATRQGGYVNLITLENNILPATIQPVNIVAATQTPITSQGGGPIAGTLNGIPGTIAATFSGTTMVSNTFTRSIVGTEDTYIDPATPFIKNYDGHEYDIEILWLGRNNTASVDLQQITLDALAACIAHLKAKNKRFLVLSVLNGNYPNEYKGQPVYDRIIATNAAMKARWPENYVEIRGPLVRAYNPDSPQDVIDFGNDIPPTSLRNDGIHPNDAGYDVIEPIIYNALKIRGWVA